MKNIVIAGNIGKDAETRQTQGGDSVTSWTVAVEERGQEKRTIWFDVSLWGKRGEALAPYLTKGGKVTVSGDLSTREYNGKTYLTIRAYDVTMTGGKRHDDAPRQSDTARTADRAQRPQAQTHALDDDSIPFLMEWRG